MKVEHLRSSVLSSEDRRSYGVCHPRGLGESWSPGLEHGIGTSTSERPGEPGWAGAEIRLFRVPWTKETALSREAQTTPRNAPEIPHSCSHRCRRALGKGFVKSGGQWADKFPFHWNTSGQALPEELAAASCQPRTGPLPTGTTAWPEPWRSPGEGTWQGLAFLHQQVGSWRV